jgi:hypothetical protein
MKAGEHEAALPVRPTARSLGALSLWFALAAFGVAVVAIAGLVAAPRPTQSTGWEIVNTAAILALFGVAPVVHLLGTVIGLAALFRANDRRGLGIAGILVNAAAVAMVVMLIIFVFRGLGAFH